MGAKSKWLSCATHEMAQKGAEIESEIMANNRIYVGNLAFQTTEHEIQNAFSQFGTVSEVKLMLDRESGRSRGFAFVTMGSEDDARKAIAGMNGQDLDGRALRVNEAEERQAGGRGGGGGGYGGGGGGGGRGGGGGGRGGGGGGGGRW
jgi:RNA recognition motif-containing protein